MFGAAFFFRESGFSRLGIAAGKKLGDSHLRNKIRRRIREIARLVWDKIANDLDLVVVAKAAAKEENFKSLKNELIHLLEKGGLFRA